jgi:hypothetical protein
LQNFCFVSISFGFYTSEKLPNVLTLIVCISPVAKNRSRTRTKLGASFPVRHRFSSAAKRWPRPPTIGPTWPNSPTVPIWHLFPESNKFAAINNDKGGAKKVILKIRHPEQQTKQELEDPWNMQVKWIISSQPDTRTVFNCTLQYIRLLDKRLGRREEASFTGQKWSPISLLLKRTANCLHFLPGFPLVSFPFYCFGSEFPFLSFLGIFDLGSNLWVG